MKPSFLNSQSSSFSVGPAMPPGQKAEYSTPGATAPAGEVFSPSELPVSAVPGGTPMSLGGFAPSAQNPAMPAPGSCDGCQTAPTGLRR